MPLVIICFSSSSYSLHVFLDEIPYGTKILLQQNERNIYREKRELGRERQKVFFSFACYLNTVCIHFFLRVAFVYNECLEDARQLTTTFTHFRIAAYTSSRAPKLMAMLGCSLLNSFLSFPTR